MNPIERRVVQLLTMDYKVLPTDSMKRPTINGWQKWDTNPVTLENFPLTFAKAVGVGFVTGGPMGITALDFDLKYSFRSRLYSDFEKQVPEELLAKMYIQKTKNGGYHWIWKCPGRRFGNLKLAQRHTTAVEKDVVYNDMYNDPKTRDFALKAASNFKYKVLIETRGEGGMVVLNPSPGYSYVSGTLQEISVEEHDFLIDLARSNDETGEFKVDANTENRTYDGVNPFNEFNRRGDGLQLMYDSGWECEYEQGKNVRLRRPGRDASSSSAIYDKDSNILKVFSTSTQFDTSIHYRPADIFILLEADGNTGLAFSLLCKLGYNVEIDI